MRIVVGNHAVLFCALGLSTIAGLTCSAEVVFDWASVGNAGNAADTNGFGAVSYDYRISKHEVSNNQFVAFLNAVDPSGDNSLNLYKAAMASGAGGIIFDGGASSGEKYLLREGRGNQPVVHVSWNDAARFTNWLHNGQGSGSTETGVYNLADGSAMTRSADANFFIPTNDEWYKAVYHDKSAGLDGTYFLYGTSSNDRPRSDHPDDDPSGANYIHNDGIANGHDGGYALTNSPVASDNPLTDVGAYTEALSPYGLYDTNGNVFEWNETSYTTGTRNLRGGSWTGTVGFLWPDNTVDYSQDTTRDWLGFRVATNVPEPGGAALLLISGGLCLVRRRRCER